MRRRWWAVCMLVVLGFPVLMRKSSRLVELRQADDVLVVMTPHHDTICREFGEAFAGYWQKETGRSLSIDWRRPGGTSEIRMLLDAGYQAAKDQGRVGVGVDVLFGGGEPDFSYQVKKGRLVRLAVMDKHPEWFAEGGVIPRGYSGERYVAEGGEWVGVCLSQFGICFNPEVLERLGVAEPRSWQDLGDFHYVGQLAIADPSKSGSVARAFELLVQSQMQAVMNAGGGDERLRAQGWVEGLHLVQRIAANARYFTDSASKIPLEVGQGNAAAGMCIDFYGKSYEEMLNRGAEKRLQWKAPLAGTTLSADPVGVLVGCEHERVAQAFVEYCLSESGQKLWYERPGVADGPKEHALHRLPIRRDAYGQGNAGGASGRVDSYRDGGNFEYDRRLTGKSFQVLRQLIKAMCLDSHEEMKSAWRVMIEAGMPEAAVEEFFRMDRVTYELVGMGDGEWDSGDAMRVAQRTHEVGRWFRGNYRRAEAIARAVIAERGRRP